MRTIAFYLPQFYQFPENDEWWGTGFTEWTNVKKSKPLYKDHYQPTVPLNNNYYSLESIDTMRWQVEIAKKYGIYGFCFYHYWFGEDRQLMEKPVDEWLIHQEIDFPYCLSWANHNWSRTWVGGDTDILMDMRYGDETEWEKHFQYLLPFFKDTRYIRIDNKPAFVVYMPQDIPCFHKMREYFNRRMIEEGFEGITILSQSMFEVCEQEKDIDYKIQYEPNCSRIFGNKNIVKSFFVSIPFAIDIILYKVKGALNKLSKGKICSYRTHSFDFIWDYILKRKVTSRKEIAGAFAKCDVSPRRQERALIYKGSSPEKFRKYLMLLDKKIKKEFSTDFMFFSAWNEWGEGMYLEPDEKYGYSYIEAFLEVCGNNYKEQR